MIHRVGTISIAIAPIGDAPRETRRHAERQAVAHCLDILRQADPAIPDCEDIAHDPHGAPILPGWQISITHSRALAAVAIAKDAPSFGIDAEEWRPALLRVIHRFLSPAEIARLSIPAGCFVCPQATTAGPKAPPAPVPEALSQSLLRLWTIKEAVYKAAATPGLPFTSIESTPSLDKATTPAATYTLHPIPHPATAITLAIKK